MQTRRTQIAVLASVLLAGVGALTASAQSGVVNLVDPYSDTIVVQAGDTFYVTAEHSAKADKKLVVDLGDGRSGLTADIGELIPVKYDVPGEYTITSKLGNRKLGPVTVEVLGRNVPADVPRTDPRVSLPSESTTSIGVGVGSVYAENGYYPMRFAASGECFFQLKRYGYGFVWEGYIDGGDTIIVMDGPDDDESNWTLIKFIDGQQKGGTHVLSPNSPYRLQIEDIELKEGPSYAPVGTYVANTDWELGTCHEAKLRVVPDPWWAIDPVCAFLYNWTGTDLTDSTGLEKEVDYEDGGIKDVYLICDSDDTGGESTTINSLKIDLDGQDPNENGVLVDVDDDIEADAGVLAVSQTSKLIVRKLGPGIAIGSYKLEWDNPAGGSKFLQLKRLGPGGGGWQNPDIVESYTDSDHAYLIKLKTTGGAVWEDTDTVTVTLTHEGYGVTCEDQVKLVPVKVDLDVDADYDGSISVDSPDDPVELSDGGIVCVGNRRRIELRAVVPSGTASSATLSWTTDSTTEKIKVFDAATDGNEVQNGDEITLATPLWVQGESASDSVRDVTLTLTIPSGAKDEIAITVVEAELTAYTPGTIDEIGTEVPDDIEDADGHLILVLTNTDDDDGDGTIDGTGSALDTDDDDELMTVKLHEIAADSGEVVLSAEGSNVRIFDSSGENELSLPITVDLADPSGSLADIASQDVLVVVDATDAMDEARIKLRYTNGTLDDEDTFRFGTTDPLVAGGFWAGSVGFGEATYAGGRWWAGGASFTADNPLWVLVKIPPELIPLWADATLQKGDGEEVVADLLNYDFFAAQADWWNDWFEWAFGSPPAIPVTAEGLAFDFFLASGISEDDLLDPVGYYWWLPDITQPGSDYRFRIYDYSEDAFADPGYRPGGRPMTVVRVSLDIFNEHDGPQLEEVYEIDPGSFVLSNADDDDEQNGVDNLNNSVDGENDLLDMAKLRLNVEPNDPNLEVNVRLTTTDASSIRVFPETVDNGVPLPESIAMARFAQGGIDHYVEGKDLAQGVDTAVTRLKLEVRHGTTLLCRDEVSVTVRDCPAEDWWAWPGGQGDSDLNPLETYVVGAMNLSGNVRWAVDPPASATIVSHIPTTGEKWHTIRVRYHETSASSLEKHAVIIKAYDVGKDSTLAVHKRTVFRADWLPANTSDQLDNDNPLSFAEVVGETTTRVAGFAWPGQDGATKAGAKTEHTLAFSPTGIDWSQRGVHFIYSTTSGEEANCRLQRKMIVQVVGQPIGDQHRLIQPKAQGAGYLNSSDWEYDGESDSYDTAYPDAAGALTPDRAFRMDWPGFIPNEWQQFAQRLDLRDVAEWHDGDTWRRITSDANAYWHVNQTTVLPSGTPEGVNNHAGGFGAQNIPNTKPVADAGADQTVSTGASVQLSGTGADADNDYISRYSWYHPAGIVTLSSESGQTTTFTAPQDADVLYFFLVVNDICEQLNHHKPDNYASEPGSVCVTVQEP